VGPIVRVQVKVEAECADFEINPRSSIGAIDDLPVSHHLPDQAQGSIIENDHAYILVEHAAEILDKIELAC